MNSGSAQTLEEVYALFATSFERGNVGMALLDLDGNFHKVNDSLCRLVGRSRRELMHLSFKACTRPDDTDAFSDVIRQFLEAGSGFVSKELQLVRSDGNEFWAQLNVMLLNAKSGRPFCFMAQVFDITRQKEADERVRTIIDTASDPYIEIDLEGCIITWNAEAEKTFGWTSAEVMGRRLSETVIPYQHRAAHERGLKHFAVTGEGPILRSPVQVTALHRNGKEFPVELTVWPVHAEGRWTFSAFVRDITERVRLEEELRKLSTVDELTGLKNRREFMNLALREIALARRMGYYMTLLFFDLDRLKEINDAFGHREGDRAIRDMADLLVRTFRDTDLIGRVGGDEFCVLETATEESAADASLSRLYAAIEDFNRSGTRTYQLSVSVGRATLSPHATSTIQELMDEADRAMYEHKAERAPRR